MALWILFGCRTSSAGLNNRPERLSGADTVRGTLRVVGNEPFTRLIIADSTGYVMDVTADSLTYRTLWNLQNTTIVLIGTQYRRADRQALKVSEYRSLK